MRYGCAGEEEIVRAVAARGSYGREDLASEETRPAAGLQQLWLEVPVPADDPWPFKGSEDEFQAMQQGEVPLRQPFAGP